MPQTQALAEAITATLPEAYADASATSRTLHLLRSLEPWRGHVIEVRAMRDLIAGASGNAPDGDALGSAKHW